MGGIGFFRTPLPVIGVVHCPPLLGAPGQCLDVADIEAWVLRDVEALVAGGVDGMIVENFGDAPFYPSRVPPETVAHMTMIAHRVRSTTDVPLGINVLRNDGFSALAIAVAVHAQFVRVNVFTGARLTDQGIVEGEAHGLLWYRKALGHDVAILADVAVKHSASLDRRPLATQVEDTIRRGKADAVIVSGEGTGKPVAVETVREAKRAASATPVVVGSGVTVSTIDTLATIADGFIVGTAFKHDGDVMNPVSTSRVREIVSRVSAYRA